MFLQNNTGITYNERIEAIAQTIRTQERIYHGWGKCKDYLFGRR